ncbi:MAG: hypothetical protein RLY70_575 [Planctomycetota bacterium]
MPVGHAGRSCQWVVPVGHDRFLISWPRGRVEHLPTAIQEGIDHDMGGPYRRPSVLSIRVGRSRTPTCDLVIESAFGCTGYSSPAVELSPPRH